MRNSAKVLIVDDDKSSSALLSEVVKRLGFKPIVANKPADALNVVRLQTVQAALVDVLLPKMSGVDLVQEFRKTKFGDNPVVFVSGVFKDKAFAADTMKKTGAVEFLFKPFGAEDLISSIRTALGTLLSMEKWSVQSLLTRKMNHARERAKAIENLEQVKGHDFPFVLSFILESGVSGHLNIVNDSGEIFGVSINQGFISEVDSVESQATAILALISNGYLAQEDWDAYQISSGPRRVHLERLVQDGLVSPHAISVAKREQIIYDFRSICGSATLQLNFVPQDENPDANKYAVSIPELLSVFVDSMKEFFPSEYLREFYAIVMDSPLQLAKASEMADVIFQTPLFNGIPNVRDAIEKKETVKNILERYPEQQDLVLECIHLLVLNGIAVFNDVYAAKTLSDTIDRYTNLWAQLKDRSPDKVFEYFGANISNIDNVNAIFEEFTRSNNPEQLPPDSTPELRELCRKCFDLVKNAHAVLTDNEKRAAMFEAKKADQAERTKMSNKITAEGLDLLRKGQFQPALKKLKEAEAIQSSILQYLIMVWAEIKGGGVNKIRFQEIMRKLDSLPADDRKSPYYFMALGLVKKGLGDPAAASYFEKVLQLDSLFVEARRELNTLNQTQPKKEKLDIFTGDITEIVSALFKRKAE
jgi:FixJ family two-component response regulator/tetratricopeptide (TPR) repeat protein